MVRVRQFANLMLAMLALPLTGCLGVSHNPSYFPSFLLPGDIVQTHAKPPGGGYFRDFDPKAYRLELTPTQTNARLESEQVLIATVFDKDGLARRGRRVEWMIEGPGHIVEVDESGWFAGRGYKVNDKYAVSYTDYFEHELTRGSTNPSEYVSVSPGQTWCVVRSAVPGETIVTAYAPGVFSWERGRTVARIIWGDARNSFEFPTSATARIGGSVPLNTVIRKVAEREGVSPADLTVRYRIAGGTPAELSVPRNVSGARAGVDYVDIPADSDGHAPVSVVQMNPRSGKTDLTIEIFKPDGENGTKTVGRSATVVQWAAPNLDLTIQAPKALPKNQQGEVVLSVANNSKVDGSPGQVELRFEQGYIVGRATPAATDRPSDLILRWDLPALAAGEKKEFRINTMLREDGTYQAQARAETSDGITAQTQSATLAGDAGLKVAIEPEYHAVLGERVPIQIVATNTGTVPLQQATASVIVGTGLEHDTGEDVVEATIGTLAPGESKTATVPLIARQTGQHTLRVSVKADDRVERQETKVSVHKLELRLVIDGPQRLAPKEKAVLEYGLVNQGDVPIPNVHLRTTLPSGLTALEASDDGSISGRGEAHWDLGELAPGAKRLVKLSVSADRPMPRNVIQAEASSGKGTDKLNAGASAATKAELTTQVQGQPALLMELAEPIEAVPVGRTAIYRILLKNSGSGPATDVNVHVKLPAEFANARGFNADKTEVKPEGSTLYFTKIGEIRAGAAVVLTMQVEGSQAGVARVRVEATANELKNPLTEDQATRVVERIR